MDFAYLTTQFSHTNNQIDLPSRIPRSIISLILVIDELHTTLNHHLPIVEYSTVGITFGGHIASSYSSNQA